MLFYKLYNLLHINSKYVYKLSPHYITISKAYRINNKWYSLEYRDHYYEILCPIKII